MVSERVQSEWANRVRAEYGSGAVAAQLAHWLIQLGAPEELVGALLRIVGDELAHARLSHQCLGALGGDPAPAAVDPRALALPEPVEGLLAGAVDAVCVCFCLGETFAVPLFDAMRRDADHPAVDPVLERVLRDEARHRAFGWEALDWLLGRWGKPVADRVGQKMPGWLEDYRRAYAPAGGAGTPLSAEERSCGLIDRARYRAIYEETVRTELLPRLVKRGIAPAV